VRLEPNATTPTSRGPAGWRWETQAPGSGAALRPHALRRGGIATLHSVDT